LQDQERIGLRSWMMRCGLIKQLLSHQMELLFFDWCLESRVTYLCSWSARAFGPLSIWTSISMLRVRKGFSNLMNLRNFTWILMRMPGSTKSE